MSNTHGRDIYKPIEQYEKRGRFGAYTDIYSLSVTFYHLLTGQPPLSTSTWRRDNRHTKFAIDGESFLLKKLADIGVSNRVQMAIKAGMEIDPNERPQTITNFRELLGFVSTSKIIASQLTDEIVIFDLDINSLDDKKDNNTLDTFNRDLESIGFDGFDEDPFAGLSDLLDDYDDYGEDMFLTSTRKKRREIINYVVDNMPTTTAVGTLAKKIDRKDNLRMSLELSSEEAIYGKEKEIKVQRLQTCHNCQKYSFLQMLRKRCNVCNGTKYIEEIEKLIISIPPRVKTGSILRISGKGSAVENGKAAGDLYIHISVNKMDSPSILDIL